MEINKDLFRLRHFKTCINKIIEISKTVHTLDNLEIKWIEQDAMIRNFEIIGEASIHISEESKKKYAAIEWSVVRHAKKKLRYIT